MMTDFQPKTLLDALNAEALNLQWLKETQTHASQRFIERGFPSKELEGWKYTPWASIARRLQSKASDDNQSKNVTAAGLKASNHPQLDQVIDVDVLLKRSAEPLPGLHIYAGEDVLKKYQSLIGSITQTDEEPLADLNLACMTQLVVIDVDPDTVVERAVRLLYPEQGTHHMRVFIRLGARSKLTLFEQCDGKLDGMTTFTTEVSVADFAELEHYRFQHSPKQSDLDASVFTHWDAILHSESKLNSRWFQTGYAASRTRLNVLLSMPDAHARINGLQLSSGKEHNEVMAHIHHAEPNTRSELRFKGVADQKSSLVFNATALVDDVAQKTFADQQNRNLLLSEGARAYSRPQMEIYADDVKCAHGTTVGQLDSDQLFYLQSRGLSLIEAKSLLTLGFALEYFEDDGHFCRSAFIDAIHTALVSTLR